MKRLIETVVRRLSDHPDEARVFESFEGKTAVYDIEVPEADRGRLIGREGRTVRALRAFVSRRRHGARQEGPHPRSRLTRQRALASAPGLARTVHAVTDAYMLVVGRVERPHGLSGEVSVSIRDGLSRSASSPESRFSGARGDAKHATLRVASARPHRGPDAAALRGRRRRRRRAGARGRGPLRRRRGRRLRAPEGFFYEHEVARLGLRGRAGRRLGEAPARAPPGAPLLSVETSPAVALVPFVTESSSPSTARRVASSSIRRRASGSGDGCRRRLEKSKVESAQSRMWESGVHPRPTAFDLQPA